MKLSFPARTAFTFGVALLGGVVLLVSIFRTLGPPEALTRHAAGRGVTYLAFVLSSVPEQDRPEVLEEAQKHFSMPLEIRPAEASTQDMSGFVVTAAIDEGTKLVAGGFGPPLPPKRSLLIAITVLCTALVFGALAVTRPLQRRLGTLEARIVDLAGAGFVTSAGRSDIDDVEHVLDWAKEQISRREAERSAFLQAVAHEIRTPPARVGFALEKLGRHPEQADELIEAIQREVAEIGELSSELSEWVRHDAQVEPRKQLDLTALVRVCVDLERDRHGSDEIEVDVVAPDHLQISGLRRDLNRAIENVLRNAFSFAKTRVHVALDEDAQSVRVLVEDDGPGVPEEHRIRVLEPFVSLGRDCDGRGGLGLGLSIASRAMLRHGGDLKISDASLGGAAVTMSFPKPG